MYSIQYINNIFIEMPITKNQKDDLKKVFQALRFVSRDGFWDLGLIVKGEKIKIKEIMKFLPQKIEAETFRFNNDLIPDDMFRFIIKIFQDKKWGIIELEDGFLPSKAYNQLRLLSNMNRMQILDMIGEGDEEININQPNESRLIIIIDHDNLPKIKIPTFLRLFGPVLYLN